MSVSSHRPGSAGTTEQRAAVVNDIPGTAASTTPAEPAPRRWTWARANVAVVDEIVIERLTGGDHVNGTRLERMEAVRRLHRVGTCPREIARRLGVHPRQVDRDLVDLQLRVPGAYAQRRAHAARRRYLVAELARAGARRTEIEVLLRAAESTIKTDFAVLHLAGTGRNRSPIRSRAQLLAQFGYLVGDLEETG